jgi:broad specificity phosphatase PhoE
MQKTIHLIRHGDCQKFHETDRPFDAELTPLGRQQAQYLGWHFRNIEVTTVYTSGLRRTIETARLAFGERNIPRQPLDTLNELHCIGHWQHKSQAEARAIYDRVLYRPYHPDNPGEQLYAFHQRVTGCLASILGSESAEHIAIVCHLAVINRLAQSLFGLSCTDESRSFVRFHHVSVSTIRVLDRQETSPEYPEWTFIVEKLNHIEFLPLEMRSV